MLSQQIADKIRAKVSTLTGQELRITTPDGSTLSTTSTLKPEKLNLTAIPWAIPFAYGGNVVGFIVLVREMPNQTEIMPLIRSIAELVMHQTIVLETNSAPG